MMVTMPGVNADWLVSGFVCSAFCRCQKREESP